MTAVRIDGPSRREALPTLVAGVRALVNSFERRRRLIALARAGSISVAFMLAWLAVVAIFDRLLPLPAWARCTLLVANVGITLALIVRALRRYAWSPIDWIAVAAAVERIEPAWNQRLSTLVSCAMATGSSGGASTSRELVDAIAADVEARVSNSAAARMLPLRLLTPSLSMGVVAVAMLGLLSLWPWLGLRPLLLRQVVPFAGSGGQPPVSSLLLEVTPGAAKVIHGEPYRVTAVVTRRDGRPVVNPAVTLRISSGPSDGFSAMSMSRRAADPGESDHEMLSDEDESEIDQDAAPPTTRPVLAAVAPPRLATFDLDLPAVDHDFRYFVTSGDSSAGPFDVRVVRRPAVVEFRITYREPTYLRHRSSTGLRRVTNADGLIEAWRGSQAQVDLLATEPLRSAEIILGGGRQVPTLPTADPTIQQAVIDVETDAPYTIELLSRDDVRGDGPATARVHAIADEAPTVRWIEPADRIPIQLRPHDAAMFEYEAADDDAVVSVRALVRVGDRTTAIDLPANGRAVDDARTVAGEWKLDLSGLRVALGDRLECILEATDSAGQVGRSSPLTILVAPNRVDVQTRNWPERLALAGRLAQALATHGERAQRRIDGPVSEKERASADDENGVRAARAAREAAALTRDSSDLIEALIAATAASDSPESAVLLSRLIDAVESRAVELETGGEAVQGDVARRAMDTAGSVAREVVLATRVLEEGARAAAALTQLDNAQATTRPFDAQLKDDARATARELKIVSANDEEMRAQLTGRAQAARQLAAGQAPVDFAAAAREWAAKSETSDRSLSERLSAAARAEAARPDADRQCAGDLSLSSRATSVVKAGDERGRFASALGSLQAEHRFRRQPNATDEQRAAARASAAEARELMQTWAKRAESIAVPGAASGAGVPGGVRGATAGGAAARGPVTELAGPGRDPRPWGDPRAAEDANRAAGWRDEDLGVYRDALRAYFKSLANRSRAQPEPDR